MPYEQSVRVVHIEEQGPLQHVRFNTVHEIIILNIFKVVPNSNLFLSCVEVPQMGGPSQM